MKIDTKTSQRLRVEVLVYQRVPEEGQCGTGRRETHFTPLSPLLFCLLPSPFSSGPTSIPNPPGATHVLDMSLNSVHVKAKCLCECGFFTFAQIMWYCKPCLVSYLFHLRFCF